MSHPLLLSLLPLLFLFSISFFCTFDLLLLIVLRSSCPLSSSWYFMASPAASSSWCPLICLLFPLIIFPLLLLLLFLLHLLKTHPLCVIFAILLPILHLILLSSTFFFM